MMQFNEAHQASIKQALAEIDTSLIAEHLVKTNLARMENDVHQLREFIKAFGGHKACDHLLTLGRLHAAAAAFVQQEWNQA